MRLKAKELGAYYTPPEVVADLVHWATRGSSEAHVLDPACGDGRFIAGLGKAVGVDIDPEAIIKARARSSEPQLIQGDFFEWALATTDRFDAVVGNPPFIRYQRFIGENRRRAIAACAVFGVEISGLASSWAPFVVAAASMLRVGGRLAFVVPSEISYATYARPVVEFLVNRFSRVEIQAVQEKLLPSLSEDCWLLHADGFGGRSESVDLCIARHYDGASTEWRRVVAARSDLATGSYRLRPFLLSHGVRELYFSLLQEPTVQRLGSVAKIGIGYVTGANDFFHLSHSEIERLGIPRKYTRPSVRSNRDLVGQDIGEQTVRGWIAADRRTTFLT
jgi:predicted RNA methylase